MTKHRPRLSITLLSLAALGLACQTGPLANVDPAQAPPVALAQLAGSPWIAVELDGAPTLATDGGRRRPSLVFKSETAVIGSAGCNDFSGAVSGESAKVVFGPFATTRKACTDEIMEQEARYLKALAEGGRLAGALENLYLIGSDGVMSVLFEQAERDAGFDD